MSMKLFHLGMEWGRAVDLGGLLPGFPIADAAPADFGGWISNLSWLIALVGALTGIFGFIRGRSGEVRKIEPQPLRTQEEIRYATYDELTQLRREFEVTRHEMRQDFDKIELKLDRGLGELARQGSARASNINRRVDELGEKVIGAIGKLEGRLEGKK